MLSDDDGDINDSLDDQDYVPARVRIRRPLESSSTEENNEVVDTAGRRSTRLSGAIRGTSSNRSRVGRPTRVLIEAATQVQSRRGRPSRGRGRPRRTNVPRSDRRY